MSRKPDDEDDAEPPRPDNPRLRHDARGNAVWEWAVDSGRHLIASTSLLLKRLEVPGLKLEEDASADQRQTNAGPAARSAQGPAQQGGGGYDPYSHKRVAGRSAPRSSAQRSAAPTAAPATKPAAAPVTRRSWWQRWWRREG